MFARGAVLGLLVLSLAAPARADVPRSDADIDEDAQKAILGYVHYGVFDSVGLAVRDGHVLLEGSVNRGHRKSDIEKRVAAVEGVKSVTSHITVQPASAFDDRLRAQLYRSIYGFHRGFSMAGVNPPVRIVVERGRVTLTGYVNSEVSRVMLGVAARETSAFRVDNRVKLDSERYAEPRKAGTI